MSSVRQDKTIPFANHAEYESVKSKLENDPDFASIRKVIRNFDDADRKLTYITEEITPGYEGNARTKVLLLFKNPHPDSVEAGLFLSEPHSQSFWDRLFEVDYNHKLLPLLNKPTWINDLADTLLSGKYDSPFLYYFRCLYPFPTKQFADLQQLFAGAPMTYRKEILSKSFVELMAYIKLHDIKHIIVFFKDALALLGCQTLPKSINAVDSAKKGIDQALATENENIFWHNNSWLRQETKGCRVYLNMNTRTKNHGTHLPKRYFTYNLEFILRDVLVSVQRSSSGEFRGHNT